MNKHLTTFSNRSPFFEMDSMFRDMERTMSRMLSLWEQGSMNKSLDQLQNSMFTETDKAFLLEVDLPGVKKENIDITVEGNILSIKGHREDHSEEDGHRSYGSFSRAITIPSNANIEKIETNLEDGVLEVMIPKNSESSSSSKKIEVKSGKGSFFKKLLGKSETKSRS
ncbi:MAG: heat-shock protein Hsp20 [Halobacteriovoraceae bacterium]|nr:heat-shock protein Hsp20 [Halobacteriovoraceae bacterium]